MRYYILKEKCLSEQRHRIIERLLSKFKRKKTKRKSTQIYKHFIKVRAFNNLMMMTLCLEKKYHSGLRHKKILTSSSEKQITKTSNVDKKQKIIEHSKDFNKDHILLIEELFRNRNTFPIDFVGEYETIPVTRRIVDLFKRNVTH